MTRFSQKFLVLCCFSAPVFSMMGVNNKFSNWGKKPRNSFAGHHVVVDDHDQGNDHGDNNKHHDGDHGGEEHGEHTPCWEATWKILLATKIDRPVGADTTFKSMLKGCLAEETGVHMDWTAEEKEQVFWTRASGGGIDFPEWFIDAYESDEGFTSDTMKEVVYENMFDHMFGHGVGDVWNMTDIIASPENLKEFILYKGLANFVGQNQHSKWMLSYLHAKVTDGEITGREYAKLAYEFMARNFGNGPMDFFMTKKLFEQSSMSADPAKETRDAWIFQYFFRQNRQSFENIANGKTKLTSIKLIPAQNKFAPDFEWAPHGATAVPWLSGKNAKNFLLRPTLIPGARPTIDYTEETHIVDNILENFVPEDTRETLPYGGPNGLDKNTFMWVEPVMAEDDVFAASRAFEDLFAGLWDAQFPTSYALDWYAHGGSMFGYCNNVPDNNKKVCQEWSHEPMNFGTDYFYAQERCEDVGCCWEPSADMTVPFCFQTDVRATCGYNRLAMYATHENYDVQVTSNLLSALALSSRLECGYPGITEDECDKKHCCWDTSMMNSEIDGYMDEGIDNGPGNNIHDPHHGEGKSPWCYSKKIRWETMREPWDNSQLSVQDGIDALELTNLFGGPVPEENACHLIDDMKAPCIEGRLNEIMSEESCTNLGCCFEQDPYKHWEKYVFSHDGDNFIPRCYKSYNILFEEQQESMMFTTTNSFVAF